MYTCNCILVGDGAGVGKGRTVAGIIYQNYIEGRKKALWYWCIIITWYMYMLYVCRLSVSNDLKYDAIRYVLCTTHCYCYTYLNFSHSLFPFFVYLHFPPAHHSFQHFCISCLLNNYFFVTEIYMMWGQRRSAFLL